MISALFQSPRIEPIWIDKDGSKAWTEVSLSSETVLFQHTRQARFKHVDLENGLYGLDTRERHSLCSHPPREAWLCPLDAAEP